MDLIAGLSAAQQAIGIVKSLRDIERDLDSATYKAQMAELYSGLADVKMALTDAQTQLHEKDQAIRLLEETIKALKTGEACPMCQEGQMKLFSAKPHPEFGVFGHEERKFKCTNSECDHTAVRKYVPGE